MIKWCIERCVLEEETERVRFILRQVDFDALLKETVDLVDMGANQDGVIVSDRPRQRGGATIDTVAVVRKGRAELGLE